MSRYIDADALKEHTEIVSYKNEWYETEIDEFVSVENIDSAPNIDICFCRECKYCSKDRIKWSVKDEDGNWIDTKCNLCRYTKLEVNLDDFCSYGKVSEIPTGSERSGE